MPDGDSTNQEADEKKQGNECLKDGNYAEATLHYTYAIKKDTKNHLLYSNRSLAFLKLKDYYHALDDAKSVIRLDSSWPKGYFRKGEVEFETEHFEEAFHSYRKGVMVQTEDSGLLAAMNKAARAHEKRQQGDRRRPWVGIGVGWLLGMLIVASHQITSNNKSLDYMIVKIIFSLVFAGLGYASVVAYAYITKNQRNSLLEAPLDLLEAMGQGKSTSQHQSNATEHSTSEADTSSDKSARRRPGGTSAGRQRFKKGKS